VSLQLQLPLNFQERRLSPSKFSVKKSRKKGKEEEEDVRGSTFCRFAAEFQQFWRPKIMAFRRQQQQFFPDSPPKSLSTRFFCRWECRSCPLQRSCRNGSPRPVPHCNNLSNSFSCSFHPQV